jgi:predicted RNA binding protein YcfA (HicA-like mRNA interferase family)
MPTEPKNQTSLSRSRGSHRPFKWQQTSLSRSRGSHRPFKWQQTSLSRSRGSHRPFKWQQTSLSRSRGSHRPFKRQAPLHRMMGRPDLCSIACIPPSKSSVGGKHAFLAHCGCPRPKQCCEQKQILSFSGSLHPRCMVIPKYTHRGL